MQQQREDRTEPAAVNPIAAAPAEGIGVSPTMTTATMQTKEQEERRGGEVVGGGKSADAAVGGHAPPAAAAESVAPGAAAAHTAGSLPAAEANSSTSSITHASATSGSTAAAAAAADTPSAGKGNPAQRSHSLGSPVAAPSGGNGAKTMKKKSRGSFGHSSSACSLTTPASPSAPARPPSRSSSPATTGAAQGPSRSSSSSSSPSPPTLTRGLGALGLHAALVAASPIVSHGLGGVEPAAAQSAAITALHNAHSSFGSSSNSSGDREAQGQGPVLSSILLNPLRPAVPPKPVAWQAEGKDGTLRTKIAAVPSEKDKMEERVRIAREKEKQLEREREAKEKELQRERERENQKVWGIPKKALMLGMGDINFNSQMAILGGWGNGSGTSTQVPAVDKKKEKEQALQRKHMEEKERELLQLQDKQQSAKEAHRKEKQLTKPGPAAEEKPEEDIDVLDPEELAAINAIINTRRSMEAAQALASGQVKMRRAHSLSSTSAHAHAQAQASGSSAHGHQRQQPRSTSQTPDDSRAAEGDVSTTSDATVLANGGESADTSGSFASGVHIDDASFDTIGGVGAAGRQSPRIRFAAFPSAQEMEENESDSDMSSSDDGHGGFGLTSALGVGLLSGGLLMGSLPLAREEANRRRAAMGSQNGHAATELTADGAKTETEDETPTNASFAPSDLSLGTPTDASDGGLVRRGSTTSDAASASEAHATSASSGGSAHRPSSVRSLLSASSRGSKDNHHNSKRLDRTDTVASNQTASSHEEDMSDAENEARWGRSKW